MARVFTHQYKTGCPEPCFRSSLFSVSTKWQSHFVEFTFFTVSKADGREKCKEWFRLWSKPTRTTGIAGRYESSQRGMMPIRHRRLIGFVDSVCRPCDYFSAMRVQFSVLAPGISKVKVFLNAVDGADIMTHAAQKFRFGVAGNFYRRGWPDSPFRSSIQKRRIHIAYIRLCK